ncbi:MAG: tRNA dihydrouridine synthase DusB [Chloroflexota bacterium]|nr:tRNA dihydrouridine synthase DusB [Chloroflexota bacterium]
MMSETSETKFYVRDIPIYGDLILSPMAGYSDLPFRLICHELGSAMSYTEFVAANAVLVGVETQMRRLEYAGREFPVVMQLFDNDVGRLVEAGLICEELGADIVDINMGCSVKNVAGRGAGAGLLPTPYKIAEIFSALSKQLSVPVTGKIRIGWDEHSLNYLEVARILEDNGASLIAVHGRTQAQKYNGQADWDAIAEIKQAVSIPVVGNGDVKTREDIDRCFAETGVDAIMIGRAAIGNPWIFRRKDWWEVTPEEKATLIRRHFHLMLDFYGKERGLLNFRKHAVKYIRGTSGASAIRSQAVVAETPEEFIALIEEFGESKRLAA